LVFALTWAITVGGLLTALVAAGKVDVAFIQQQAPVILAGAPITIFVSVVSITIAIAFAILGSLGRISTRAPIYALATLYVSLVRGTPLIVQILFVYLALPQFGIVLPPLPSGILALSFNYGAYMTEIFRAGIQAVPRGQVDAAHALGMTDRDTMRRIVLPQALRIVTPAIGNEFIAMIKDSALVSIVSVQEMLFYARVTGSQHFRSFETFLIAATVYWILTIGFSFFQELLERRFAESDRRI
jgi:polar amino acid transport system permease protein